MDCKPVRVCLYPWAHFEKVTQPVLKNGVEVHSGNQVRATINDQETWVTLDSGISRTVLGPRIAYQLGFLRGNELIETIRITTLVGTEKVKVVKLKRVVFTFENGQSISDRAVALLEALVALPDDKSIVLGAETLTRSSTVQTFHQDGTSTLFIHDSKLSKLYTLWRLKGAMTFEVLPDSIIGTIKTVLVSTGVEGFYYSKSVARKWDNRRSLTLDLGGSHSIKGIDLEPRPGANVHFIMGRRLLHQCEATVDFRKGKIFIPRNNVTCILRVVRRTYI